jgi:hypothetical protein
MSEKRLEQGQDKCPGAKKQVPKRKVVGHKKTPLSKAG